MSELDVTQGINQAISDMGRELEESLGIDENTGISREEVDIATQNAINILKEQELLKNNVTPKQPEVVETTYQNNTVTSNIIAEEPKEIYKKEEPMATFIPESVPEKIIPIEKVPVTPESFLKNITVDLDNITVVDMNPITEVKDFEMLLNNKSKTQIVAIQSGYVAYVEGYNFNEINALINSTLDDYGTQLLLAQTVHKRINTTSLGKLSFNTWAECTSYYDLESFLYGNYLETFPGDTKFQVKCGTCKEVIDAVVNNDTLISAKNDATLDRMKHIMDNRNDTSELVKTSILTQRKKIFLDDSKIIIEFKLPSIKKHLDLLSSINSTAKEKSKHILELMLFIDKLLMMNVQSSMRDGKAEFYPVSDRQKMATILGNLTNHDAKKLGDAINEFVGKYSIEFKIKSFVCPKCQTEVGDIAVDMETLLFFQMLR